MKGALKTISIKGFKSIRELNEFHLEPLNIIVGANGAGKSNLLQIFKMLSAMSLQGFSKFIKSSGGSDGFLHNGPKGTEAIECEFTFQSLGGAENAYRFHLSPTINSDFLIEEERKYKDNSWRSYGSASEESRLKEQKDEKAITCDAKGVGSYVYDAISGWMVYHFHDTGDKAPMRRYEAPEDYHKFRSDASNIAPFLLHLKNDPKGVDYYQEIVEAVRLVIPFFEDFRLDVDSEKGVRLSWQQKGSDFPMQPNHFSDGSIRFICLATALLQPCPPSAIVIDEPELGMHPEAIRILAELIKAAAERTQLIVATQSPLLLDYFSVEDIIIAKRKDGQSTFERLKEGDYTVWLEDYTLGELWSKNVIEGGTVHE